VSGEQKEKEVEYTVMLCDKNVEGVECDGNLFILASGSRKRKFQKNKKNLWLTQQTKGYNSRPDVWYYSTEKFLEKREEEEEEEEEMDKNKEMNEE
jgi:hypothetical protein